LQQAEIRALAGITGKAVGRPTKVAREVHHAVTRRVFGALGPLAAPVRVLHDPLSTGSYRAVGAALRAPLWTAGLLASKTAGEASSSLAESPVGAIALGAANGFVGDRLAKSHPELAVGFSLRHDGHDLALSREALRAAYPEATGRVAIFIHGLCETEHAWASPYPGSVPRRTYGQRLQAQAGITPLYLRYNTGLHVSDNGRALAATLEQLAGAWPNRLDSIVLVGHSMGGLVARSACHYAESEGLDCVPQITHVICLGTPHLGAPLEKAANVLGWPFTRLPETRPFAELFVNGRSAGIKDLRFGSCVEEDWCECDPDEFLRDRCREVPFLDSASYHFVAATLSRRPHGVGGLVGDLLVTHRSASGTGRRRRIPFAAEHGTHVGGIDHLRLLNDPLVYEQLEAWLADERPS
jgi:pimeloyl-ACP methyl ester carboxylesterase